jgi:hypothetical protein
MTGTSFRPMFERSRAMPLFIGSQKSGSSNTLVNSR